MYSGKFKNPIICAIDMYDIKKAHALVEEIHPYVGGIKLGLEFFTMNGPKGVEEFSKYNLPIFLDLKFHDIPNTVGGAIRNSIKLNIDIISVHACGGSNMIKTASKIAADEAKLLNYTKPLIIGVTVLTNIDETDFKEAGYNANILTQVKNLASLSYKNGLDGIVCSPGEIKLIRDSFNKNFKIIVPGIRPADSLINDQKRTMTPKEAIDLGADFLVIGRPVTQSPDPVMAIKNILKSIN